MSPLDNSFNFLVNISPNGDREREGGRKTGKRRRGRRRRWRKDRREHEENHFRARRL